MKILPFTTLCILFMVIPVPAESQIQERSGAVITLYQIPPNSRIRIRDSVYSCSGQKTFHFKEGKYHIIVPNPDRLNRRMMDYDTVVTLKAGQSVSLICRFPEFLEIESSPFGADVYADGLKIGQTPVQIEPASVPVIEFRKRGFADMRVSIPDSAVRNGRLSENLVKINPVLSVNPNLFKSQTWHNRGERRFLTPLITALSLSVMSGAAAAYCKKKADDYFEEAKLAYYFGNIEKQKRLEKKTRRYDRCATVGFIGLQVNVAASVYFLFRMN